jgi:hypothetical protein
VKVSLDNTGNSGAVYLMHSAAGVNSVHARILTSGNAFVPDRTASPFLLDQSNFDAQQIWTGMASNGNSVTGWLQSDGQAPSIFNSIGNHFSSSPGCPVWTYSAPSAVETLPAPAIENRGAVSPAGFAANLWTTADSPSRGSVLVRVSQ